MRLEGDHCHDLVGDQCHDLDGDHCHDLDGDYCHDLDGDHDDGNADGADNLRCTGDTKGSPSLCEGGEGAQGRQV